MNKKNKIGLFTVLMILWGLIAQLSAQRAAHPCRLHLPDSTAWSIRIDDRSFVVENRVSLPVPCGRHYLRLYHENDRHWQRFIFADSVTFSHQDSTLLQLAPVRPPFLPRPFPVARIRLKPPEDNSGRWSFSSLFEKKRRKPALIITAVAANWLSFYLKRRADTYYDRYRKASSLSDMRRYYKASSDFDRYSVATLSLSAAAMSIFLYLLISE